MRKISVSLYQVKELNEKAKQKAIGEIQERREESFHDHAIHSFLKSAKRFAKKFGFELINFRVGLFGGGDFLKLSGRSFDLMTTKEKNELVKMMNETWKEETDGKCSLTGVDTDALFFDYFKEKNGTTIDTFKEDIVNSADKAMYKIIRDYENSLMSDEDALEYAEYMDLEFYEDGSIYNG